MRKEKAYLARTAMLCANVTPDERELVRRAAAVHGVSCSEWVRRVLFREALERLPEEVVPEGVQRPAT